MHSTELQDDLFILKEKKLHMFILIKALHRQQQRGAQVDTGHLIWTREKPSISTGNTRVYTYTSTQPA